MSGHKDIWCTRTCGTGHSLVGRGGGGGWHKASVLGCLPLAAPIGPSPLLILTLCGPERVLVVSTEPLDDLSYLTGGGGGSEAEKKFAHLKVASTFQPL